MTTRDRKYWHTILDQALDGAEQGRSFLPLFVDLVLQDALGVEPEQGRPSPVTVSRTYLTQSEKATAMQNTMIALHQFDDDGDETP